MIANTVIPTSGVDLIVAGAGQSLAVVLITITNFTAASGTVDLHSVPNNQVPSTQTVIMSARPFEALDFLVLDTCKFLLSEGDRLYLVASQDDQFSASVSYLPI